MHKTLFCLDAKLVGPIWGLEFVLAGGGLPRKQGLNFPPENPK